jgi:hypothetical protein
MKSKQLIFASLLTVLCLWCAAGAAFAQGTSLGTIRGTVTDANQALVAGAKVQVTDLETGLVRDATSNNDGTFEITGLKYGTYKISVSAQGFKTGQISEVAVRGSDTVRADVQLQVGGASETVEISSTSNVISLETPTVSGTLNTQQLLDLPRDNRDIYSFLYLNPNITQGPADGSFKFIGAQSYGASFTLDGQRSNGGIFGEPTASQPSLEAVGELTVLSNNFSAEYPGIANIRVTTKRGGRDYHGSAFYNNKNSALAAWTLDDKIGQSLFRPTPALDKFPTPYFNLNETGGSLHGPVPWTRNKTFFLVSYERRWLASPVRFRSTTLPHATLLAGDFRRINDANKPVVPAGVTLSDAELAANTIVVGGTRRFVTIPARLINPTTAAVIKNYYPVTSPDAPINATNGRLTDFFQNVGGLVVRDLGTLRIDHDFSEKDKFYAVYNASGQNQRNSAVVAPYTGLGLLLNERTNHTLSLSYTRVFSERLINEARGGFNRQDQFRRSNTTLRGFLESIGFDSGDIAAYGAVVGEAALDTYGHPQIQIGSFANFGSGGRNTFRTFDQALATFGDTLTWVKGRHSIKTGFDVVRNLARDGFVNNRGFPRGNIRYTGSDINPLARFLLGLPANSVQYVDKLRPFMDVTNWEHGYFVQDDFKIAPRLTLYLGLRYELISPFVDKNDLLVNFDPNFVGPNGRKGRFIVPSREVLPNIDPRMITYGVATADEAGVGRGLIKTDTNNLAPRLGVAWAFNDKTVLRGGYGIFYPTSAAQGTRDAMASSPFNQGRTRNNTAAAPLSPWPGATHGFSPLTGGALATVAGPPSANAIPVDLQSPRIQQFNVTFERELGFNTGVRISYLGTRMSNLIGGIDLNMLAPSNTPFGVTTGNGTTICDPTGTDTTRPCDLSPADRARRPFPELDAYLASYGNFGTGRSHALQIEVNRRFTRGLMFNASYTLLDQVSSALDVGASSLGGTTYNQFDPNGDRARDAFVSRHRFIAYSTYDLPFGRGRRFGGDIPRAVDLALGQWQLSMNMFAKSGTGFTPFWTCDNCGLIWPGNIGSSFIDAVGGFNQSSLRPLVVGDPESGVQPGFRWSAAAFGVPTVGADLLNNPAAAKRNFLTGPGTWGVNLGVRKNFRMGERLNLHFDTIFDNVFNHPLLSPSDVNFAWLGSFNLDIDQQTGRLLPITRTLPNPDFGRLRSSFPQENIDSRRSIRLALRLTF